ncbi:MAG: DUF1579 family protein [Candidatus Eisenbacteria bacterium]|uniref:DUF1579 family protein n=1 Tax=Eiseniibacteriota bacterium TaxID=2212470 RepID=A0A956M473_UNCEI|nr:DUF1579 family protein [Candidatus Eisenbacteria bacterium]
MKKTSLFALGALVCLALPAMAEEPGMNAEAMAAWQEMMTPGPHHEHMAKMAGDWTVHSKMMMDPSAPPMETDGTAHMEMEANGLFLRETVHSPMMGMPWEGHGVFGFDKGLNKHVAIWYDSFGSMIMNFEGGCTDNCGQVTLVSDYTDPMTNQPAQMKIVSSMTDADHMTNKMYSVADGKDTMMGEILYTRKK